MNIDLPPSRSAGLRLKRGDRVYATPRKVRVFEPEYSI